MFDHMLMGGDDACFVMHVGGSSACLIVIEIMWGVVVCV